MSAIGLVQIGSAGIQAGIEQAERAAHSISQLGTVKDNNNSALNDIAESSVDLLQAKNQVRASAAVIRAADETLGSIINTSV